MHNNTEPDYIPDMEEKLTELLHFYVTPSMGKTIKEIQKSDYRDTLSETLRALLQEAIVARKKRNTRSKK